MSCNHPLYSYWRTDSSGTRDKVFAKDHSQPFMYVNGNLYTEKIELPCGQCMACRLKYSRDWATRCMLEAQQWQHNYFVTLTYDDSHVPFNTFSYVDYYTGEVVDDVALTLVPSDLQDFMKRLRINFARKCHFPSEPFNPGVRFYACGEYGGETQRPHYHLCLFNCPIPDLEVKAHNFRGETYYHSDFIQKAWSISGIPIGFVCITDLTYETCAYVARYMTKKHKGKSKDYYELHHIAPEFSRMSLKPGIARDYFDKNKQKIYEYDQIIITGSDGKAKRVRPPRYYDLLYDIFSPEDMQKVKDVRITSGKASRKQIEERTTLPRNEYLSVCEDNLLSKVKSLPRKL